MREMHDMHLLGFIYQNKPLANSLNRELEMAYLPCMGVGENRSSATQGLWSTPIVTLCRYPEINSVTPAKEKKVY